ncbi:MAG TPA: serine hydrolase [Chitinophagaceae bacterium]|nr:serine hydrolase [Chitinophagaceae bacterium]
MKALLLLLLSLLTFSKPHAQKQDRKTTKQLQALIKNFNGEIGVYVKNLGNNKVVAINADTIFPTASMVKVPILIGIMDKINKGELAYHQELIYRDSLLYEGVDILGSYKDSEKVELSKVVLLMLSTSDNTASLWLQGLAGTGTRINALLDSMGFLKTRVNSRTPGREADRTVYGWGQTSPREMALLLEKIYNHQVVSEAASDRMLRSLNKNYWDGESLSQLPPDATIFSKNGAVDASRSEVVLVRGKKSTFVFCVCTKNNKDQSWEPTNEAWQLTRKIARLLYKTYEKKDNWQPAIDADRFN